MVLLGNSIKKKEKLKPIKNKMLVFLGQKVSLSPSFFHFFKVFIEFVTILLLFCIVFLATLHVGS